MSQSAGYVFPSHWAGKPIRKRIPYTMAGELLVPQAGINAPFPDNTFQNNIDMPLETHEVELTASVGNTTVAANFVPAAPPPPNVNKFWRVRIRETSSNQTITRNAQLVDSLVDLSTNMWAWAWPYTVINSQGYDVAVDNLLPAAFANNVLRAEITFKGYLLVLEPATQRQP